MLPQIAPGAKPRSGPGRAGGIDVVNNVPTAIKSNNYIRSASTKSGDVVAQPRSGTKASTRLAVSKRTTFRQGFACFDGNSCYKAAYDKRCRLRSAWSIVAGLSDT